ncbi:MAG: GNAT family N-acetyltransferase [Clostridiales bacterium]|nr:GNAT family N-acetyltransferase [Clostridiales bacterium]
MEKPNFDIFAEDNLYLLKPIGDEDRDNYMKTVIANADMPKIHCIPGYNDILWSKTPDKGERIFCIFEKTDYNYCGFCNIRRTDTSEPEIGISLLSDFWSRGIGSRVLPLMMKEYISEKNADYFIAKVYSNNYRCLRLMEKIGAVQTGTEKSEYKRIKEAIYISLKKAGIENSRKKETEDDGRYICVLKILPESLIKIVEG